MDRTASSSDMGLVFQSLQSLLLGFQDVEHLLEDMAVLAAALAGADVACGITVSRDGQPLTVASSDSRASALDESQYDARTGPCLQALGSGQLVDVPDVGIEERWPSYLSGARATGLRCSLSLPLSVGATTLGAMNLYGFERSHLFTGELRERYLMYAAQASGSLRLATAREHAAGLTTQLEAALASRTVIDQALGIVMAQRRCDADHAFAHLRMLSQASNRKLRVIAADVVTQVTGGLPTAGRSFRPG